MGRIHVFMSEYENANGLGFTVDKLGLLMDIKALLKEYYIATFDENGSALEIAFNNGQKFTLTVQEV